MSTTTATRTTRTTPPQAPTRHRSAPRRTLTPGRSVIGRDDRPVLRIVASRTAPEPSVEVPPRRVDLEEFFAPEYDGDDQRVEVVRRPPSSLRLTRRGRLVVFGAGVVAALGLGVVLASGSMATDHGEQTRVVTVQPGQTLWDLSARAAGGGDVRSMMTHLESINHLDSTVLQAGQHLRVPR